MSHGDGRLFDLGSLAAKPIPEAHEAARYQSLGVAAEHAAIARLLDLGHKVAVPVTDDDGVDLIVNYRWTVQVKSAAKRNVAGSLVVNLQTTRSAERRQRPHGVRDHVDIFLFRDRTTK